MNWRLDFINMQTNLRLLGCFRKDSVSQLIRFANYPYTFYNQLNQEKVKVYPLLANGSWRVFEKTWKHVNPGKTQCWALFVISTATFTKTAIKPKFDDRFSLKNFSVAFGQCTIKSPILVSIETF